MKFRYKVLMVNLILLSISLGIVGYLMIRKNFELAQSALIQNAIVENNLVQSSVEYDLLQVLNSTNYRIEEELLEIGERVAGGMITTNSSFYIKYANKYIYSSDEKEGNIDDTLFNDLDTGGKNYMICEEEGQHYVYVTSYSSVEERDLCVVSKSNISEAYQLMERGIQYFRFLILAVLLAASFVMYLVSMYLTRPLENLNRVTDEIAQGHYDIRAWVSTTDEIGFLADKFNHMAHAIEEHIAELNDMIRRRDQFVADFTHEIKTPMTTIIGYTDTMRSMELPREQEIMSLNYIFSEGKRLEVMSQKLFELIYLKNNEIEKQPLHIEDLEAEIIRIVTPALEKKEQNLVSKVDAAVIHGNRELLVTVFINFIDNARKASKEGSEIALCGSAAEDGYELAVVDHGIGITEEDQKRICDEFYMVDKSRARREGGAGLGMSLAALILERHGAVLAIESQLGKGTAMRVFFPFSEEEKQL